MHTAIRLYRLKQHSELYLKGAVADIEGPSAAKSSAVSRRRCLDDDLRGAGPAGDGQQPVRTGPRLGIASAGGGLEDRSPASDRRPTGFDQVRAEPPHVTLGVSNDGGQSLLIAPTRRDGQAGQFVHEEGMSSARLLEEGRVHSLGNFLPSFRHYSGMDCLQAREAMSAQMDGESTGVSESLVEAHVQRCDACQGWREAAFDVTRRADDRLGALPRPDHRDPCLSEAAPIRGWGRRLALCCSWPRPPVNWC